MTELLFATAFWGFGFIGTIWALKFIDTPAVMVYRFAMAFLVGAIFLVRIPKAQLLHEFRLSIGIGFLLAMTLLFQTYGLTDTTATKSAFITTLYVVFVPIIAYFTIGEKLYRFHFVFVTFALLGTALIVDFQMSSWSFGDSMTLINALIASFQIVYLERIAPRSKHPFALNVFQAFWCVVWTIPVAIVNPGRWSVAPFDNQAWIGILALGIGSSLLAFYFQIRAQSQLPASLSSLLFLMESPFSFFFAFLLLGERLSAIQVIGALVILLSCAGAVWLPRRRTNLAMS